VNALETKMRAVLDKTLLAQRINQANSSLGVTAANLLLPGAQPQRPPGELEKNRIIAETINTVLHEVASDLDDADRMITGAKDEAFDDYAELFHDWRVSVDRQRSPRRRRGQLRELVHEPVGHREPRRIDRCVQHLHRSQAAPLDDAG